MDVKLFKDVARNYKSIFFDSYGVLRNYQGTLPGVREMFEFLAKENISYFVLTNDASRSPEQLAENFSSKGIPEITADRIISSGMIAKDYLGNKVPSGTIVYLGTEKAGNYIRTDGVEIISINDFTLEQTEKVSALVLLDDEGFDWNTDLSKAINLLREKNVPVVVASTDLTYPVSKSNLAIAIGSIANLLEPLSEKVFVRFGKPDSIIFNHAYEYALAENPLLSKRDILMVGDTLKTDILGGNKFGIDTCLVLTGNIQAKNAQLFIAATGITPNFICESVTT